MTQSIHSRTVRSTLRLHARGSHLRTIAIIVLLILILEIMKRCNDLMREKRLELRYCASRAADLQEK